jgi:Holliday junction DNA helicase RuvA
LKQSETAALWTHLAVREDSLDLYGFSNEEELRFFELLLTVSGIGPKSALAILDIATTESLRTAISTSNASYLTKVSGIGRKTAEKIILELRDKVGVATDSSSSVMTGDEEAMEAMRALGYSMQEARDALRNVPADIKKPGERLRAALKTVAPET